MRFSQENENSQGATSHQPPPQSRAQKTFRLRFPKVARLRSNQDYRRVLKANRRFQGQIVSISFRQGESSSPKLGITVSKKYGKAHLRNYFKRLVREAFRESIPFSPRNIVINVSPRPGLTNPTKKGIVDDLAQFYTTLS